MNTPLFISTSHRLRPGYVLLPLLLLLLGACGTTKRGQVNQPSVVAVEFNADSAYTFCSVQCDFGPRTMNSEAHEQCLRWIQQKFEQYGCQVLLQQADLQGYDGTLLHATNIIATTSTPQHSADANAASSSASDGARPRILLCAHWDSRPWADNDPDSANWRKPVMAANDGASGVAVMLEVARLLQKNDSASVDVDFICFDAEDWGIPQWEETTASDSWALGAQHWAATTARQSSPAVYQYGILLDMVGGQGARFCYEGYSMKYARKVVDRVWQAAAAAGYASIFPAVDGVGVTDDHVPVNEVAGIPCIDIIPYYSDCPQSSFGPTWHTVTDDMQHIDRNTLKAVGQTLVQLIYQ